MATEHELLEFHDFQKAVGASMHMVRAALMALGRQPVPLPEDQRQKRYPRAWVAEVQQWLHERGKL